jgi:hypothetical protein
MRNRLVVLAFAVGTAISLSASAQTPDQVQTWQSCGGLVDPPSNQVFVYTDINFGGTCAALVAGFYPNSGIGPGTFGLPNDSISSLKVGSAVRARLFVDGVYGGTYFWFGGTGAYATLPTGWNDATSSIRVEINSRSTTCNDLQPGEYALFQDPNYGGDCVVLQYAHSYPEPVNMGIANDSVSSVNPGPGMACPTDGTSAVLFLHASNNYQGSYATANSGGSPISFLSSLNDQASSSNTQSSGHHACF